MTFNFAELWGHMPLLGKFIALGLAIMMVSFIGVTIERLLAFARSAKESRAFALQAGKLLEEWKVEEIVVAAEKYKIWPSCSARSSAATSTHMRTWAKAGFRRCSWPATRASDAKKRSARSSGAA
jgi:hypothetical protein